MTGWRARGLMLSILSTILLFWLLILPSMALAQTWPNEPSGATVLSDHDFTVCEANGWTGNCGVIASDATAPLSPTSVMRWTYNTSTGYGGGEVGIAINKNELYLGYWVKLSNPFQGGGNGFNKLTFGWDGDFGHGYWTKFFGVQGSNQFFTQFHLQGTDPSIDNSHVPGGFGEPFNKAWNGPSLVTLGVWHRVELYYKHSTTRTARNGIARLWLDGNLEINLTTLNTPDSPIQDLVFTPTWTPPVDRTNPDMVSFDHVRVSTGGTPDGGADTTPPSQVTGLMATGGANSVSLSWAPASDDSGSIGSYQIDQCQGAGCSSFTNIASVSGSETSYFVSGLAANTIYGYRVGAVDPSNNLGPYSSTAYATTSASTGSTTNLSITTDGRFALNGMPTFLQGISYYDGSNWHSSDIDFLTNASRRFNLIVVHCDDVLRNNANSCYNSDGSMRPAKQTALEALIDYADARGMVVDVVCLYADVDGSNSAAYLTTNAARTAAVTNCVNAFKANGNVMFSVVNEHNYGAFASTESLVGALFSTARTACPSCILFYSSSDNFGTESDAHLFTTRSGSTVDTATVNAELANGISALAPHDDRQSGWHLMGGARCGALRNYLDSIGRQSMPVFFEEPGREGNGTLGDANLYLSYFQSLKNNGCAGGVLHTDAGFDLSVNSLVTQLNSPVETTVVDSLADALASGLVRDTAVHTLTCDGTAADIGASWDAGYTSHNAMQTVSGRCRTAGANLESLESYNGTMQANAWIEADTPTLNASGSYSEVRLGFYSAPATVNGYECRFGRIPSDTIRITRKDNNSPATLNSLSTTITAASKKACERVGSTITALIDNVPVLSATDTTYSGVLRPGIYGYAEAGAGDVELDNVALGNFTTPLPPALPKITDVTTDATGADVTWTGPVASIRVLTDLGSTVYPIASFPNGRLTRTWVQGETFACFFARDSSGAENSDPADYQCRPVTPAADTTPPVISNGQPSGVLTAGTTAVLLSWNTNETATCKLGASDDTYANLPTQADMTVATSHSHTLTGLSDGTAYTRYIRCQDFAGNANASSFTISFSIATPPPGDTTKPSDVTGLTAVIITSTQITYSWTAATDNSGTISFYRLYLCGTANCSSRQVWTTTSNTSVTVGNLSPSTTYTTTVTAVDPSGNESNAISNIVSATTFPIQQEDPIPPSDVTALSLVSATYSQVDLSWPAATDNIAVRGYPIERCRKQNGVACSDYLQVGFANSTTFTDRTAIMGQTYQYRTHAQDLAGNVSVNYTPVLTVDVPLPPDGTPIGFCPCRSRVR